MTFHRLVTKILENYLQLLRNYANTYLHSALVFLRVKSNLVRMEYERFEDSVCMANRFTGVQFIVSSLNTMDINVAVNHFWYNDLFSEVFDIINCIISLSCMFYRHRLLISFLSPNANSHATRSTVLIIVEVGFFRRIAAASKVNKCKK